MEREICLLCYEEDNPLQNFTFLVNVVYFIDKKKQYLEKQFLFVLQLNTGKLLEIQQVSLS